jgi:hypothetical protein
MRKTLLLACFLSHICAFAQQKTACILPESEIQQERAAIYIKTQCPADTTKGGWTNYTFITKNKVLTENAKTQSRFLVVNQAFYTGFIGILSNETDSLLLLHQYNKGRFEQMDTILNDAFQTLKAIERKGINPIPIIKTPTRELEVVRERDYNGVAKKPVLYLYPTEKTDISVTLNLREQTLVHPYPAYKNGWRVTATPDGTLTNTETGRTHYCLFWEAEGKPIVKKINTGFVVEGAKTASFLEEKLPLLGLSPKETNEFIIFWLPLMENKPYNLIYFAKDEYNAVSELKITPKPDQIIRIMMVWQSSTQKITLPEQKITPAPTRKGFVAVEWGGQELSDNNLSGE